MWSQTRSPTKVYIHWPRLRASRPLQSSDPAHTMDHLLSGRDKTELRGCFENIWGTKALEKTTDATERLPPYRPAHRLRQCLNRNTMLAMATDRQSHQRRRTKQSRS